MNIPTILRDLRRRDRISQQELADAVGLKRQQLARYETGSSLPTIPIFEKILHYFGLKLTITPKNDPVSTPHDRNMTENSSK